jgi:hypothetical protein
MLASDLTRAQSVSYERVHRLDQLSSFIPANLFESKSLTLKAAGRHRLTGIKSTQRGRGMQQRAPAYRIINPERPTFDLKRGFSE